MDSTTINNYLKKENLEIDVNYLNFIKTDYVKKMTKTVNFENHDWLINKIEIPFLNNDIISEEFDSINSCLKYYGTSKNNPAILYEIFHKDETLIENWAKFKKFHPLFKKGFLVIGFLDSPHSSILLIGINKNNNGQIWIAVGNSNTIIKMADNIYEFKTEIRFKTHNILTEQFGLVFIKSPEGYYEEKTMPNNTSYEKP